METTIANAITLKGPRRELTKELFEELCALQCRPKEILGHIGMLETEQKKLESWCRKAYGRRYTLEQVMGMVRMDGLIAIRRASFDQLKKSATIIAQQYNRFLPNAGMEEDGENMAVKAFVSMMDRFEDAPAAAASGGASGKAAIGTAAKDSPKVSAEASADPFAEEEEDHEA